MPDTALHYTLLSQNSTRLHSQVFQRAKLRRSEFKSQVWVDKYREDLNPCFSGVVLLQRRRFSNYPEYGMIGLK